MKSPFSNQHYATCLMPLFFILTPLRFYPVTLKFRRAIRLSEVRRILKELSAQKRLKFVLHSEEPFDNTFQPCLQ